MREMKLLSLWGVLGVFLCLSPVYASTNSTALDRGYIVEHNLFSPDRSYTPEQRKGSAKVVSGVIKLSGIIMVGDLREAVISIKGANPPVVVLKEGEEANGCKVVSVTSKEVVVERNGKKETLVLEEDKKPSVTQTASAGRESATRTSTPPPEEVKPTKEEIDDQTKSNPFFKILESVRKNAGKRGEKGPPLVFPFH